MSDIESAIRELGIDYKLSGDEAIARCPSHNDRHPSWSVNTRTGVHHCFSCGFSGNLASLAAHTLNLSYQEAVLWCNERVGWSKIHQWEEDYQGKSFSPAYLKVGEVDTALFTKVPTDQLALKGITEEAADKFGILWNPRDETWIFPVRDPFTNELWGWQSKNDRHFRHYPQGIQRSKTLFGLGAFPDGGTAVLVESPIDCAYLYAAGISGGLSSFGVQVSNRQFSLVQYVARSLVLALDNDLPGVDKTARRCEEDDGVRVFNYLVNPEAKDPGEMRPLECYMAAEHSVSSLTFLLAIKRDKELRKALDVYRDTGRLPKASEREVYRPWKSINRVLNGSW
jgi:DNA primase